MLFCFGSLLQGDYHDHTDDVDDAADDVNNDDDDICKKITGRKGNQFWTPDNRADVSKLAHPLVAHLSLLAFYTQCSKFVAFLTHTCLPM